MTSQEQPTIHEFIIYVEDEHVTSMFVTEQVMIDILSSSPKIIPYSHLNFTPELGDFWDGEKFVSATNSDFHTLSGDGEKYEFYAYVVDGVVRWIQTYPKNEDHELMNAVMLSNPRFERVS
jgi:hypothetical protein